MTAYQNKDLVYCGKPRRLRRGLQGRCGNLRTAVYDRVFNQMLQRSWVLQSFFINTLNGFEIRKDVDKSIAVFMVKR